MASKKKASSKSGKSSGGKASPSKAKAAAPKASRSKAAGSKAAGAKATPKPAAKGAQGGAGAGSKATPAKAAKASAAATPVAAKAPSAAKAAPSRVAKPIRECKPGWLSRIFHIETGSLVACDAGWTGTDWERGDSFRFLYRSRRNKYFLLRDVRTWSILTPEQARQLYDELPEKLATVAEAFEAEPELEVLPQTRDDDEDDRIYKLVRNDKWEFSIWLDYKEVPKGWWHVGITGPKMHVLDFVRRNCVFGAPNPGLP